MSPLGRPGKSPHDSSCQFVPLSRGKVDADVPPTEKTGVFEQIQFFLNLILPMNNKATTIAFILALDSFCEIPLIWNDMLVNRTVFIYFCMHLLSTMRDKNLGCIQSCQILLRP